MIQLFFRADKVSLKHSKEVLILESFLFDNNFSCGDQNFDENVKNEHRQKKGEIIIINSKANLREASLMMILRF